MLKIHAVESVHYKYERDSGKLEKLPYKVFRISTSTDDVTLTIKEALDNYIKDLVEVVNKTRE